MGKEDREGKRLPVSFITGTIALVFLIVGYQVALFLNRAAISKILSEEVTTDTVYIVDRALAESVLSEAPRTVSPDAYQTGDNNRRHSSDNVREDGRHADHIIIRKDSQNDRNGIRIESDARGYRIDRKTGERYSRLLSSSSVTRRRERSASTVLLISVPRESAR